MAKKVILDVDTGTDDAIAIMQALGCDEIDVVALCTVWGNFDVQDTTENTLRLAAAMGREDIPVYMGCGTAMVKYLDGSRGQRVVGRLFITDENGNRIYIHNREIGLPETSKKPERMDAVSFYIDYLRSAEQKVTVVPVGPLTNLGIALSIAPDIAANIEEIVIMGGGDKLANASPSAESNVWHDPEAAEIVARCGAPVLWVPLDAFFDAQLTRDDAARLRALGTFAGGFAAGLIEQCCEYTRIASGGAADTTAMYDAMAVSAVIDRSVLTEVLRCNVHVSLKSYSEGETIIDRRCSPDEANCSFAVKACKEKFMAMLCQYLGKK